MARRAAPHRGIDVHYGAAADAAAGDEADARPSKSALKRNADALQDLGLALAGLTSDKLAAIAMPEPLADAIAEYRRIRSHEARRRQLQYVGKLMRNADEAALREAVAAATLGSARDTLALHEAERWRAELIEDDETVTRWLQRHPASDGQQLRSLVRAARRDAAQAVDAAPGQGPRHGRSHRELFQFIKPWVAGTGDADPDARDGADDPHRPAP